MSVLFFVTLLDCMKETLCRASIGTHGVCFRYQPPETCYCTGVIRNPTYQASAVLQVAAQFASTAIISPPVDPNDENAQRTKNILAFLPLMIGYFALQVPSGLSLYYFSNTVLTSGQQIWLRKLGGDILLACCHYSNDGAAMFELLGRLVSYQWLCTDQGTSLMCCLAAAAAAA